MTLQGGSVAEELLACPKCHESLGRLDEEATKSCPHCGLAVSWEPPCFRYDSHALLRPLNERAWLRHQVLQNNGYIAYLFLKEGSLSLPARPDVQEFGRFIAANASTGDSTAAPPVLLDIGSGTLPLPGYLVPVRHHTLIGLDPFPSKEFPGLMIVGCCEFLPLADASVNNVVFGTSFDHLMDYQRSIEEVWRVLKPGGRILIWMGDRSGYVAQLASLRRAAGAKRLWRRIHTAIVRFWKPDSLDCVDPERFFIYPNNVVLPIPDGAVDPFHTLHEYPAWVRKLFDGHGFRLLNEANHGPNLVLLAFEKPA